jgi:hypothetical protein
MWSVIGPVGADLVAAFEQIQRRLESARRVVLVRDRRAEDGHHGVTDEFLDKTVEARDRPGEALEQRILKRAHILGVEPLGDGGEAREVGEHDRHLATIGLAMVAAGLRRRCRQRTAAARAEGETG